MSRPSLVRQLHRAISVAARQRAAAIKQFGRTVGLVHFGSVDQHTDEHEAIHGFAASLSHNDSHYMVGTYNGYNIRFVDRFDVIKSHGKRHEQTWALLEIELESHSIPHTLFIPTGKEASEYSRVYATQLHLHPLNSMIFANHSPEFHGRFQILANPTHAQKVSELFTSPLIVGIASRFWPHAIELEHNKLIVYITEHRLTKTVLESTLASALWLAEAIDSTRD